MAKLDQVEKWKRKLPASIVTISLLSIAIGQFNDTIVVVDTSYKFVLSTFTDIPSNNKLDKLYINASSTLLEETFGAPVYIKTSSDGVKVKYYRDKNYLLSAISENNAIVAFLIFPIDGYVPNMRFHAAKEGYQDQTFSLYAKASNVYSNTANIGSYYIEEVQGGQYDLLYKSISGSSDALEKYSDKNYRILIKFNEKMIMEEDITTSLNDLRHTLKPNFYGYSKVELATIQQGILSNLEYKMLTQKN